METKVRAELERERAELERERAELERERTDHKRVNNQLPRQLAAKEYHVQNLQEKIAQMEQTDLAGHDEKFKVLSGFRLEISVRGEIMKYHISMYIIII